MGPANECLSRQDLTVAQIELRLVVKHELARLDRHPQLLRKAQSVAPLVELLLIEREGRVAELGPIHSDIRAPPETVGVRSRGGRQRDAYARPDAHAHPFDYEGLFQAGGKSPSNS